MAIQNKPLAAMNGGLFTVSFDYDDVALTLQTIHVINNDTRAYTVAAWSTATGKRYESIIAAGATLDQPIPPGAANRLQLSVTPSGKLDGVGWSIS